MDLADLNTKYRTQIFIWFSLSFTLTFLLDTPAQFCQFPTTFSPIGDSDIFQIQFFFSQLFVHLKT
jgi:hypothetical protein